MIVHNLEVALAALALLLAGLDSIPAVSFHEQAAKLVAESDFGALQDLADQHVTSGVFAKSLKAFPEEEEAVDWSMLLRQVGRKNVNVVFGSGGGPFLSWLVARPDALADYVHGGAAGEVSARSLGLWSKLWTEFPESREAGVWRRFAIATALVQSQQVYAMADGTAIDPVARFRFYRKSFDNGVLSPYFAKAPVWELRYVAGSWALDSDLAWAQTAMKPEWRVQESVGNACWMVPYRETNAKGVSVQTGSKFYDDKPMTLQLMTEYGGVCGAISRYGTSCAQAIGIPAMPVAQPGHCAFFWRNTDSSWLMGNDVFGWGASTQHEGIRVVWGPRPAYVPLYDMARRDEKTFLYADRLTYAATLVSWKQDTLTAATQASPLFLPAWRMLVGLDPARFGDAANALGVSPFAVHGLLEPLHGDSYLVALRAIAAADEKKQLGTQTWVAVAILGKKLNDTTHHSFDVRSIIDCRDKRFKWDGTDPASQALVVAAINAIGSRGDISAQFEKLLKG